MTWVAFGGTPIGDVVIQTDEVEGHIVAAFTNVIPEVKPLNPSGTISVLIRQGRHVGRPSLLTVDIPVQGGIVVSGTALPLPLR